MFGATSQHKDLAMAGEETFTFLARGFEFKGTLTFEGTVRIDGTVSGAILSKGTIILGEHAVVEGDISGGTIVSGGTINGNVSASERVHLLPTAALTGDLKAPVLKMEEGVRFHGNCVAEGRIAKGEAREEAPDATPHQTRMHGMPQGEALEQR